jgi:hypothetical protein
MSQLGASFLCFFVGFIGCGILLSIVDSGSEPAPRWAVWLLASWAALWMLPPLVVLWLTMFLG